MSWGQRLFSRNWQILALVTRGSDRPRGLRNLLSNETKLLDVSRTAELQGGVELEHTPKAQTLTDQVKNAATKNLNRFADPVSRRLHFSCPWFS